MLGDWVEYDLPITVAGNYRIDYRAASQGGSSPGITMSKSTLPGWMQSKYPILGGWQTWQTVEGRVVTLEAGN